MTKQDMTSYLFTSRLKAETRLELFDKYYLAVSQKGHRGKRDFKLELATLNPEVRHVKEYGVHWLGAAGIASLAALYFLNAFLGAPNSNAMHVTLGAGIGGALLTALFIALFALSIKRKLVLETRTALHPLIEIPYHKRDKKRAEQFVTLLQGAIEQNITEKGYNNEHLFAGEMRMLRRLAKNRILTSNNYDRAKKQMLQNGNMGFAS